MTEPLNPCPHGCNPGPENEELGVWRYSRGPYRTLWQVHHCSCGATGPFAGTRAEAIAAWNQRALPGEAVDLIRQLLVEIQCTCGDAAKAKNYHYANCPEGDYGDLRDDIAAALIALEGDNE
jgi:hypothetical protein